jgi:hypothetical protein
MQIPEARMLYLNLHECPAHGDKINDYFNGVQRLLEDEFEWVVVDIRNNLGGSLLPLFILTEYLFDQRTARAFSKCQKYTMKTNQVFKQLYYD